MNYGKEERRYKGYYAGNGEDTCRSAGEEMDELQGPSEVG